MHPNLQAALMLLNNTPWHLFSIGSSGFPHPLCSPECEAHRDAGSAEMEDCTCVTCHAAYSATRDPDRLREMWERFPHGLLAVRTGLRSDLFVLDFDVHPGGANGLDSLRNIKTNPRALPYTVSAYTGGGGVHLFYQHPGDEYRVKSSSGKVAGGVDVKGENSFVILPPSRKAGKAPDACYRWVPEREPWNHAVMEIDPLVGSLVITEAEEPRIIDTLAVDFSELAEKDLREALDKLIWAAPGTANNRLFFAACRAGEAVYAGVLDLNQAGNMLHDAASKRGVPTHEISKTVRSGMRTGMADAKRGRTRDVR